MPLPSSIPTPARFKVSGGAPASVRSAPPADRLAYWRAFVEFAREAKARELALGLDRRGERMAPLSRRTISNRRSAMGPADPAAPPLQPAHGLSRTRALFVGEATPDGAVFGWSVDPTTDKPWGLVLKIHRAGDRVPVRDVIGLSPDSLAEARRRATEWWEGYLAGSAGPPTANTPIYPDGQPEFLTRPVPKYSPKDPSRAVPKRNARVSQININGDVYTLQGGSAAQIRRAIAEGRFSGFKTAEEWRTTNLRFDLLKGIQRGGPPPPPTPAPTGPPRPKPTPGAAPAAARPDLARKPRRSSADVIPAFPVSNAAVTLRGGEPGRAALARLLGRVASDAVVASLVGAPDDAAVLVDADPDGRALRYAVEHPAFAAFHGSIERPDGALVHRIESIEVAVGSRGSGVAARVHGRQVHWGLVLDVVRLTLRAARTDEKTGHLVWPEFGYDGPIPDRIRRVMPEPLHRFATLLELLEDEEGRDWWQAEGRTIDLAFDLKPGSRSRKRWNEYLTRKGLDPNAGP